MSFLFNSEKEFWFRFPLFLNVKPNNQNYELLFNK